MSLFSCLDRLYPTTEQQPNVPNNSLVDFCDLAYQAPIDGFREAPTNTNGLQTLMSRCDYSCSCCETEGLGNWYSPDGNIITSGGGGGATFRANRGQNEVINGQQIL